MVRITVCRGCGWTNDSIRLVVETLRAAHGNRIEVVKKSCLDACKKGPAVKVGKKLFAPAKPKKLLKRVQKKLRQAS